MTVTVRVVLLLLLLSINGVILSFSHPRMSEEAEQFRLEGNQRFSRGEYKAAVELYSKSLARAESSFAFSNRAACYLILKEYEKVLDDSVNALRLDSSNSKALYRKAMALYYLKRIDESMLCAEECLDRLPNDENVRRFYLDISSEARERNLFDEKQKAAENLHIQGREAFLRSEYDTAIKLYNDSLAMKEMPGVYSSRAEAYLKSKKFLEALADANIALRSDSSNTQALYVKGAALLKLNHMHEGSMCLEECLQRNPNDPNVIALVSEEILKHTAPRVAPSLMRTQYWKLNVSCSKGIRLFTMDYRCYKITSWQQLTEEMASCHQPLEAVILEGIAISEEVLEFFRKTDPMCFQCDVDLVDVDFGVAPTAFEEMFNGILNGKGVCFYGFRGMDGLSFSKALNNFSAFCSMDLVKISTDRCNAPLSAEMSKFKVDMKSFIDWLHLNPDKIWKTFVISQQFISATVGEIWEALFERFLTAEEKSPYCLQVQIPHGAFPATNQSVKNHVTDEILSMENIYFPGEDHSKVALSEVFNPPGWRVKITRKVDTENVGDSISTNGVFSFDDSSIRKISSFDFDLG